LHRRAGSGVEAANNLGEKAIRLIMICHWAVNDDLFHGNLLLSLSNNWKNFI
jgi:hypothetical protein